MQSKDSGPQRPSKTSRYNHSQLDFGVQQRKLYNHHYNDSDRGLSSQHTSSVTSETDDDDHEDNCKKAKTLVAIQQRPPRLLLKAIGSKGSVSQAKTLPNSISTSDRVASGKSEKTVPINDNIGISSSDNELPDLVSAAIKCVENATDDDDYNDTSILFPKRKPKTLQQYQSTLLQDFVEKTQMLSQPTTTVAEAITTSRLQDSVQHLSATTVLKTSRNASEFSRTNTNSQTGSVDSHNVGNANTVITGTKRRGRPKKSAIGLKENGRNSTLINVGIVGNINESGDSGVISTSTTLSMSPSPNETKTSETPLCLISTTTICHKHKCGNEILSIPSSNKNDNHESCSSNCKPKIDIAYFDKRMYAATERVLYPPPRNKPRHIMSSQKYACTHSQNSQNTMASSILSTAKEDPQLDPVWRKIDVNKKFRRPSVSGYKSDGGGGNLTICSKILAAKSGYVSDYGHTFHPRLHYHHSSGYRSDASCKSRYSVKSCASRRTRAKSCGYRSDFKESTMVSIKSGKFRRKRRSSILMRPPHSKSVGNFNDDQDILQLAGLSLGQSGSEESNEYVCKPSLDSLPTTSVSKKYGEINRFITTGEYFGRGIDANSTSSTSKNICPVGYIGHSNNFKHLSSSAKQLYDDVSTRGVTVSSENSCVNSGLRSDKVSKNKLLHQKSRFHSDLVHELLPHATPKRIKSRRSSVASYCSSYYSGTTKIRRRRRRSKNMLPSRTTVIDSKLLTEIDILTSSFNSLCRIQCNGGPHVAGATNSSERSINLMSREKAHINDLSASKFQNFSVTFMSGNCGNPSSVSSVVSTSSGNTSKRESRDKRASKKRKTSENHDFALISAVGSNIAALMVSSGGVSGTSKRRHKKTSGSSPDDHKLPLKKRHYIKTPSERLTGELAAKMFANSTEAWAAAAALAKSTAITKSQQQYAAGTNIASNGSALIGTFANTSAIGGNFGNNSNHSAEPKGSKAGITPKKRHLLHSSAEESHSLHHNNSYYHHHSSVTTSSSIVSTPSVNNCGNLLLRNNRNMSPLQITVRSSNAGGASTSAGFSDVGATSFGKFMNISSISMKSATVVLQSSDVVHKKRSRLEGLVSKIAGGHSDDKLQEISIINTSTSLAQTTTVGGTTSNSETTKSNVILSNAHYNNLLPEADPEASCPPPPGVFEPSIELEIQIPPPISKMTDATSIVTKSEVDSPLLLELNKNGFQTLSTLSTTKTESSRGVIESLLNETVGNNLLFKRKRKKINRTGFPTVRRKKRKIDEPQPTDATVLKQKKLDTSKRDAISKTLLPSTMPGAKTEKICESVSDQTIMTPRTPRLSVVSLERLQGTKTVEAANTDELKARDVNKLSSAKSKYENIRVKSSNTIKNRNKKKANHILSSIPVNQNYTLTDKSPEERNKNEVKKKPSNKLKKEKNEKLNDVPSLNNTPDTDSLYTVRTGRKLKQNSIYAAFKEDNEKHRGKESKRLQISNSDISSKNSVKPNKQTLNNVVSSCKPLQHQSVNSTVTSKSEKTAFTKSSMQKIITAKSLEGKVKLPAGLDPNTNFSCKIRLKRRNSLYPLPNADTSLNSSTKPTSVTKLMGAIAPKNPSNIISNKLKIADGCQYTKEEIDAAIDNKDVQIDYAEHDVLPPDEGPSFLNWKSSDFYLLEEERNNNGNAVSQRKSSAAKAPVKKNYLVAGFFSDYYKQDQLINIMKPKSKKKTAESENGDEINTSPKSLLASPTAAENTSIWRKTSVSTDEAAALLPLLPPPPYCESYYRRSQQDFELPYDIWWAYTNSKLPTLITVPSWNYRKIRTNIYADAVRPNLAGIDHPVCICKADIGCGENCLNRMVYTECSPSNCPTREKCQNQKIQRHEVAPGVERFMTKDKGWGVRAKLPIVKGTYILEYVGEVVTEREFKNRMGSIYLNDIHHYCLHLDGGLVIDGHRMGSDGRFVNHSCQPNCEMQKWSVNGLSRMALFARRNIESGEELTYDYNFSLFNPSEGQPCRCNTSQCRGVIGGKSQRVKPLPNSEQMTFNHNFNKEGSGRTGRQRKHKARKNTQRLQTSKELASVARSVQQLSEKEKKSIQQYSVFLVRNYEKIRHCLSKRHEKFVTSTIATSTITSADFATINTSSASQSLITNRRLSASPSLAAQISALCSPRNMKTRGLTLASQDPQVEKMARMAIILRDICTMLDGLKDNQSHDIKDQSDLLGSAKINAKDIQLLSDTVVDNKKRENNNYNVKKSGENTVNDGDINGENVIPSKAAATTTTTTTMPGRKKKASSRSCKAAASSITSSSSPKTNNVIISSLTTNIINFKTMLTNIEQGYYKTPKEFDEDMEKLFTKARQASKNLSTNNNNSNASGNKQNVNDNLRNKILDNLILLYKKRKSEAYVPLLDIIGDEDALNTFKDAADEVSVTDTIETGNDGAAHEVVKASKNVDSNENIKIKSNELTDIKLSSMMHPVSPNVENLSFEDVIRCICGLSKDEGLMIQCAKCMVWQHTECTKADVNAENYMCEKCEPRDVDREIGLDDFTEEGYRYYLALLRDDLHIRQGDAVYVLRDIPVKDIDGNIVPMKKHTYETIGNIDYNECDIFRVERLWKNTEGKRFIFGHHFLRPHETYHEPTRRFYPNEVVRVPLYEVVPIELVIGRCWVLDRTTFCKGRPIECTDDRHCYICELRVDKSARFFSKAKTNYPTCTKSYAFRKFSERLKICKTYAPHDVDPALTKTKKQKTEQDFTREVTTLPITDCNNSSRSNILSNSSVARSNGDNNSGDTFIFTRKESNRSVYQSQMRKRKNGSPNLLNTPKIQYISSMPPTFQILNKRRNHLENVLRSIKLYMKNVQGVNVTEKPVDLSYLLSGRGARQRKVP